MAHIQRLSCGVGINLRQQGQFPAFPEGQWYGTVDSGAVLEFVGQVVDQQDPMATLVDCVRNLNDIWVNLTVTYVSTVTGLAEPRQALVQINHQDRFIERLDPNVNNEDLEQLAIDNALQALFRVLLPAYVYRGNLLGFQ